MILNGTKPLPGCTPFPRRIKHDMFVLEAYILSSPMIQHPRVFLYIQRPEEPFGDPKTFIVTFSNLIAEKIS